MWFANNIIVMIHSTTIYQWIKVEQEDIVVPDVLMKKGYREGLIRREHLNLELDSLPESQAGTVRHKSPHAAYAAGYLAGVEDSYKHTNARATSAPDRLCRVPRRGL